MNGIFFGGGVSERPKVQLSKSCVGESPPWVQIPPSPPILECNESRKLIFIAPFPMFVECRALSMSVLG